MRLRRLEEKDASLMLEWMKDISVVYELQTNFVEKDINDCLNFIKKAKDESHNVHRAIEDEDGEYLGTVSLKNIYQGYAEFAITIRKKAMGTGVSREAMQEMLLYGLKKLDLTTIYWCVKPSNIRALKFYEKNGYKRTIIKKDEWIQILIKGGYSVEQISQYIWYVIRKKS